MMIVVGGELFVQSLEQERCCLKGAAFLCSTLFLVFCAQKAYIRRSELNSLYRYFFLRFFIYKGNSPEYKKIQEGFFSVVRVVHFLDVYCGYFLRGAGNRQPRFFM